MNIKQERLNGIIQREVSDIIQFSLKNPHLGLVTVTDVDVTGDYSLARIYVTLMGQRGSQQQCLQELQKAKGFIRSELGKRLTIRKCPDLKFQLDDSLKTGNRIEALLKDIKE